MAQRASGFTNIEWISTLLAAPVTVDRLDPKHSTLKAQDRTAVGEVIGKMLIHRLERDIFPTQITIQARSQARPLALRRLLQLTQRHARRLDVPLLFLGHRLTFPPVSLPLTHSPNSMPKHIARRSWALVQMSAECLHFFNYSGEIP